MDHLSPQFIKEEREAKVEIIMIKVDTDQIVDIGIADCNIEVYISVCPNLQRKF